MISVVLPRYLSIMKSVTDVDQIYSALWRHALARLQSAISQYVYTASLIMNCPPFNTLCVLDSTRCVLFVPLLYNYTTGLLFGIFVDIATVWTSCFHEISEFLTG